MATINASGSNEANEATNGGNGANGTNGNSFPVTDPAVYQKFKDEWSNAPLPSTEDEWVLRARAVAEALAVDAVQRDAENKSPKAEITLLKHAGLLKVLGLKKYGGGAQPWEVGYKVIREVAKADG
jgi:alkylation response protein AidB-like acyl-CoA dehydrogenase